VIVDNETQCGGLGNMNKGLENVGESNNEMWYVIRIGMKYLNSEFGEAFNVCCYQFCHGMLGSQPWELENWNLYCL
jgi:hypothetical protein